MGTYEYIVVGAGSAGAALAGRLSEDPETTVLLLEAGGPGRHLNVRIPAAFSKQFRTTLTTSTQVSGVSTLTVSVITSGTVVTTSPKLRFFVV